MKDMLSHHRGTEFTEGNGFLFVGRCRQTERSLEGQQTDMVHLTKRLEVLILKGVLFVRSSSPDRTKIELTLCPLCLRGEKIYAYGNILPNQGGMR